MLPEIETSTVFKISTMCRFPGSSTGLIGRIHPDVSITVSEAECVSYSKMTASVSRSLLTEGSALSQRQSLR